MELTIEKPNIDKIDKKFHVCIIDHNKKYDDFLIKCHFKSVFNSL